MDVMVNGEKREVPHGATVSTLLESLQVMPERVVVEVNLTILKRAEHAGAILQEGDQVEIVRLIGGGSTELSIDDCRFLIEPHRVQSAIENRKSKIPQW